MAKTATAIRASILDPKASNNFLTYLNPHYENLWILYRKVCLKTDVQRITLTQNSPKSHIEAFQVKPDIQRMILTEAKKLLSREEGAYFCVICLVWLINYTTTPKNIVNHNGTSRSEQGKNRFIIFVIVPLIYTSKKQVSVCHSSQGMLVIADSKNSKPLENRIIYW